MTVSMSVMSAGDGYKYLLKSVAVGDGNRAMATPLTRYYAETGCPPGRMVDLSLNRASLFIADSHETVRTLNERAAMTGSKPGPWMFFVT